MRVFNLYCEDSDGKIYAYDSVTALVARVIDGKYIIEGFLPEFAQGIKVLNFFVYKDYLVMMGLERYSFLYNLKSKQAKILDLGAFKEDKNGWRVSNIITCEDGLLFVPRVLSGLKKFYFDEFGSDDVIVEVKDIYDRRLFDPLMLTENSFVRGWGAYKEKNKIYMILSEEDKDCILITDVENNFSKRNEICFCNKLFHLGKIGDSFFAQGIKNNDFYMVKFDLNGTALCEYKTDLKIADFHSQWLSNNHIIIIEGFYIYIFDENLNHHKHIQKEQYFYVYDKFFYDKSSIVMYDNCINQFKPIKKNNENFYTNEEYLLRIDNFYRKIGKELIKEDYFQYDLNDYLHTI